VRLPHTVTRQAVAAPPVVILAGYGTDPFAELIATRCIPVAQVHRIDDRPALLGAVTALGAALVIAPALDLDDVPTAPLFGQLLKTNVAVAVCIDPSGPACGLLAALRAGAELLDWSPVAIFQERIQALVDRGSMSIAEIRGLRHMLRDLDSDDLTVLLVRCTTSAHRRLTVSRLANELDISCRTLHRITSRAGWPAPTELIAWGRVLRACLSQWSGSRAASDLARVAGFRNTAGLRRAMFVRFCICARLGEATPLRVGRALNRRLMVAAAESAQRRKLR
jgi:AraC-like DNA-binding protein